MPGMKKKSSGWEKYKAGMDRMASKTAARPAPAPKRTGAEGPKKSMKVQQHKNTWRPPSKGSEGPKKRMPRKAK